MELEVTRHGLYLHIRSFELFAHTSGHLHSADDEDDSGRVLHFGPLEVVVSRSRRRAPAAETA